MPEKIWYNKKELALYFIILTSFVFLICINYKFINKLLLALSPILIIAIFYILKKPSAFLIFFFFMIPLASPYFLSIGPITFAEILSWFALLFGIFSLISGYDKKTEKIIYKHRDFFVAFFFLCFIGMIASLVTLDNSDIYQDLASYVFKLLLLATLTLIFITRIKSDKELNRIFFAILISSFLVGIVCFYAIITLSPSWAIDIIALRISGTFPIYNHLSGYELLMIFFSLGLYLEAKNKYFKIFLVSVITLSVIAQITSLTLGGILGILIGIISLINMRENKLRNFLVFLIIITFLSITALIIYPPIIEKMGFLSERLYDRLSVNYAGIKIIRNHFWFGVGSEIKEILFKYPSLRYTPFGESMAIPHNLFITTFAERGVFLFISFLYIFYIIIKKIKKILPLVKLSKNRDFYKCLIAGMIAFLVQCMTNNLFWHPRLGVYFFLYFALLLRLEQEGDFNFPSWM